MTWLKGLYFIAVSSLMFCCLGLLLTSIILLLRKFLVKTQLCKIEINNDASLTKNVSGGETLLNALLNNGIAIPSPCGGKAACKQCKVRITDNASEPLETDKGTFSKKQLAEGWRLSCQCKIHHDLKLEIEDHYLTASTWEATVISNHNVATFIKELVIQVSSDVPYRSGGYLQISVPPYRTNTNEWKKNMDAKYYEDWEKYHLFDTTIDNSDIIAGTNKAYSFASYPDELPLIKFNIRIATPPLEDNKPKKGIPWGVCSSYVFSLNPGDKITISGPYGESFMKDNDKPLIFLIGGAGSSFGRSHILDLLLNKKTKRQITLWYGARSLKENIYQDEYEKLDKEFANFTYNLVLSEPSQEDIEKGWDTEDTKKTNFVFKAFEIAQLSKLENPEDYLYYLCGPPIHNSSILKLLDDYGVERSSIILDDFGS